MDEVKRERDCWWRRTGGMIKEAVWWKEVAGKEVEEEALEEEEVGVLDLLVVVVKVVAEAEQKEGW